MNNKKDLSNILDSIRSWSLQWDIESLLFEIVKDTTTIFKANFGSILLLESDGLKQRAKWPLKGIYQNIDFQLSVADEVIRHGNAIYAHNLLHSNEDSSQAYCIPLTANRGVLGVIYLEIYDKQSEITKQEQLSLEMLGVQAASYIENSMLYHSAITDPLTGLFSHRHFQTEIDRQINRCQRDQAKVTLMIIDLDNFKSLNDQFGHPEGNICLIKISQILKEHFRSSDIIARFGGDEFEILLPDANSMDALEVAKKLIEAIQNQNFPLRISATIGISVYPDNAKDAQSLFLMADQALYEGKEKGKACAILSSNKIKDITDKKYSESAERLTTIIPNNSTSYFQKFDSNIAHKIDGQEVIGRIASSSNGEVLLVNQNDLNRTVALKQPLTANLSDHQLKAFNKEALITASLNHPGVIPLYNSGTGIDGRAYYTMKAIEGKSLEKIFRKIKGEDDSSNSEYSIKKLCDILLQTAETIAYAHNNNVVHFDIHPGNIIVGDFGEITLIDWGKGVFLKSKNEKIENSSDKIENYVSGLPNYKAPEFFKSDGFSGTSSDIYSLGIILFEILTKFRPFEKATIKKTIDAIINEAPVTPEELENEYSADPLLSNLIHLSINKDPLQRISAEEFTTFLNRYVLQEKNLITHYFHTKDNPIKENDWKVHISGEWSLNDGVWTAIGKRENILLWKKPVTSDLSFTCEAWITTPEREISVVCCSNPPNTENVSNSHQLNYKGYYFQLGSDNQMFTKLARRSIDVQSRRDYIPNLGQKYMVTISYIENWIYCYVDNNLVFSYKEIHPSQGYHIGLYSWKNDVHFRPIKIEYQKMGLSIPTINLADEHFSYNRYDSAIDQYNEIILNFPERLEAIDAKLKLGICHSKIGNRKLAEEIFLSLKNTFTAPLALAELACLELFDNISNINNYVGDYKKANKYYSIIFDKYPNSQAKFTVLDKLFEMGRVTQNNFEAMNISLEENTKDKIKLLILGSKTLEIPCKSQMKMILHVIKHYVFLGEFNQAYLQAKEIIKLHFTLLGDDYSFIGNIMYQFHAKDDQIEYKNILNITDKSFIYEVHPLIFFEYYYDKKHLEILYKAGSYFPWHKIAYCIIFNLINKNSLQFQIIIETANKGTNDKYNMSIQSLENDYHIYEMILSISSHDYYPELKKQIFPIFKRFDPKILNIYYLTVKYLFNFDFLKASELLIENKFHKIKYLHLHQRLIIIMCLLSSLKNKIPIEITELNQKVDFYLTGYSKELAKNMLKGTPFKFSNKWPRIPYQCYFERVLYAIWLLHKKEWQHLVYVLDIIENNKYGDAIFQQLIQIIKAKVPIEHL
ncbi:MAG: hypothetical protein COA79_25845 [Planctomycetota bacterium]|nr:MAG: hypothetical protein COA79_25845 [Planctomycetota bacterium]